MHLAKERLVRHANWRRKIFAKLAATDICELATEDICELATADIYEKLYNT